MADRHRIAAYVLLKIAPGRSRAITEEISKLDGVRSALPVTGMYDIIAYVEAPDINTLTGVVRGRIQTIDGVRRTHTAIVGELVTTGD